MASADREIWTKLENTALALCASEGGELVWEEFRDVAPGIKYYSKPSFLTNAALLGILQVPKHDCEAGKRGMVNIWGSFQVKRDPKRGAFLLRLPPYITHSTLECFENVNRKPLEVGDVKYSAWGQVVVMGETRYVDLYISDDLSIRLSGKWKNEAQEVWQTVDGKCFAVREMPERESLTVRI